MPNDDSLKDGIAKYTGQAFKAFDDKFQDQVYKHHEDGSVERLVFEKTEDLLFDGHKMQSTLKRDIAHARLQLAITQALCVYIEETNMPERVGLTEIDFEHHGTRVSVKVEIGESEISQMCMCKENGIGCAGTDSKENCADRQSAQQRETCKEFGKPDVRLHSPDCGTRFRGCSPDCEQRMFEDLDDKLFDFVESVSREIEDKEIEGIRQQAVGYLSGLRDRLNWVYAKRIESKSSQKTQFEK